MKLRDRMIFAGIVTADLKRRHKPHVREFFRDLLHVCDDHGRFEADAGLLRAVLCAPILDRVSERDVEGYLRTLSASEHGDIKLYTVRGKRYGKVTKWRQGSLRRLVAEYPPEDGEPELPLGLDVTVHDPGKVSPEGKKEGNSPHSPPPAGGVNASPVKKPKVVRRRSPERQAKTLRNELLGVEQALEEILRPGGAAYNIEPTGEKRVRYDKLMTRRMEIKDALQSFPDEDAA